MKIYKIIIVFLLALILQISLLNLIAVLNTTPSLILCSVLIFTALYDEEIRVIAIGGFFGMILDLLVGQTLGLAGIVMVATGVVALVYKSRFNMKTKISMLPLTVAASVLYYILSFILHCLVGNPRGLFLILPGMVIGTLYNLAIVYILYFTLIRHSVRYMREKRL